jgi:LemA protein
MNKKNVFSLVMTIIFVSMIFTSCGYNGFVEKREAVDSAWSNVETQYQRRNDLIPNLVATVKGFAAHEEEVYASIADARSKLGGMTIDSSITDNPEKFEAFQKAQNELSSGLSRLLAITENYPQLKSNENFLDLQTQLEGTENRISTARTRYNDAVRSYNTAIAKFPGNITAKMFNFEKKSYFSADPEASKAPTVSF